MNLAHSMQKIQDWITQQWVILFGRSYHPTENPWLDSPFGEIDGIGEKFIQQLAEKESLIIENNLPNSGLLSSIKDLQLPEKDLNRLSKNILDFYENTVQYELTFEAKWNPIFIVPAFLVQRLFSQRIHQFNLPLNTQNKELLSSEIIQLISTKTQEIRHTIWLRKNQKTNRILYAGVYGTCTLPNQQTCIRAVFPLPKGNTTVILKPRIGVENELILESKGKRFSDAGFYFLVNDSKNNFWANYIASFQDRLIVRETNGKIVAQQTLYLWNMKVATFDYHIDKKTEK